MSYSELLTTLMSFALIGIGAIAIYARIKLRWVEGKLKKLEWLEEARADRGTAGVDADRMAQIEAGLDRLEARMEQLAEGQEFLGRVLADRAVPPGRERRQSENTPH